jgi:hypothetical protein
MATITRTRVLITAIVLAVAFAAWPHQASHAATGGTIAQIGTDTAITSTATGVTVNNPFPDGNKTAQCFIQVTIGKGTTPQPNKYGNCTGYSVTITCGSVTFDDTVVAPDTGAGINVNGTASWTGMYDQGTGTGCTHPDANTTLSADITGTTTGQNVVSFWNTDTTNSDRSGCVQHVESAAGSTPSTSVCFHNLKPGKSGTFYEATAQGATGIVYETKGDTSGNIPLGGVFFEAPGQAAAPTTTPGGTTNTPLPAPTATATPRPAATTPARLLQFGTDVTLTATGSGVTSSQAFPDGATTAGCFVQITSKSGPQTTSVGSCAGYTVNVTCSSFQFNNTPTTDQHGAAVVIGGVRQQAGGYDTGGGCAGAPAGVNATLTYSVSGVTAGTRLVFYWNDDANTARDGCVSYADASGASSIPACFTNSAATFNGTFYEVAASGTSGTAFQTKANQIGGQPTLGSSGNLTAGGVFIAVAPGGVPLSATSIKTRSSRGLTTIRWFAPHPVAGFNVYDGPTRLNSRLVTSKNQWYSYSTRHTVHALRLLPVRSNG